MGKLKLKGPRSDDAAVVENEAKPIPLSPLNISGVVVKKKDLIEALRVYVPLISDIQVFEDGEQFYIYLDGQGAGRGAGD